MSRILLLFIILITLNPSFAAPEWGQVTPSHVFQQTQIIIQEIEILREAIGIMDIPFEPEPQTAKTPIHVYSKGLEVLEKIARVERKLGMAPAQVPQIPLKPVIPKDVFQLTQTILDELRKIKAQLAIGDEPAEIPFIGAKTPSHVYEEMWRASYMLDGLTGSITPNEVHRNTQYLVDEIELIAAKLKVNLEMDPPPVTGRKRPKDAAQQALLAFYKLANLQNRLRMDSASIPAIILVRVTPSDVYDITNMLMAEIVRVKVHMGITLPRSERLLPAGKKPSDVYAMLRLVNTNLDKLIRAAASNPELINQIIQDAEVARSQ